MVLRILLCLLFTFSAASHATSFYAGLGVLNSPWNKMGSNEETTKEKWGHNYLILEGSAAFSFGFLGFDPKFGFSPLGRKLQDDAGRIRGLYVLLPLSSNWLSFVKTKIGPGFLLYSYSAEGGTIVMNNGSSTQTFYKPDQSVTSSMIVLNTGLSFDLPSDLVLDLDMIFSGLLSSKRALSLLAGVKYEIW